MEALRVAESALLPFTNVSHSGVGIATVRALNPSACGVLASVGKFRTEALARKNELHRLPRLAAKHGALGWLGSLIRFVFEIVHEIIEAGPEKELLRTFALTVFEAADIPCERFHGHRYRLDKFFAPVVRNPP